MFDQITPLILTFNEAPNIGRVLERLAWAKQIVVVDSGSTDETLSILSRHANVRVFHHSFTSHAEQWNFGLQQTSITSEWVLALDADFILSDGIIEELKQIIPSGSIGGYQAPITYCVAGRSLRGGLVPPLTVLFRRDGATYVQDGHTQLVKIRGMVALLSNPIFHDDQKPLSQWLASQARYMRLEAKKLRAAPTGDLGLADRIRRFIFFAPPLVFLYCLLIRGNFLDGREGFFYAMQRAVAEGILALYLIEESIRSQRR